MDEAAKRRNGASMNWDKPEKWRNSNGALSPIRPFTDSPILSD
jgi:hypothetical protein